MRYSEIKGSKHVFQMPSITLGSVFFGTKVPENTAFSILDAYYEKGGNWLDTARVYGTELISEEERKLDFSDSEEVIGRWIKSRNIRDKITLVTKGAHGSLKTGEKRVNPDGIYEDMETSLQKLGLDSVDIYFLHKDDPTVSVKEIMPAMHALIQSGKTKEIGCSNWTLERFTKANEFAVENGLTPFSISQVKWSYAVPFSKISNGDVDMGQTPEEYERYREMNMPVMAYSSQARGFFLKAARANPDEKSMGKAAVFLSEQNKKRAEIVKKIAETEKISISAAAFSYLWSKEIPVTALIGPSSVAHLLDSMEDCDYVPTETVKQLLSLG